MNESRIKYLESQIAKNDKLYHDLDASGDIDKNFIGFPLEPFGISNDAWNRFSAPRWKEASFHVRADTTIVIHLKH